MKAVYNGFFPRSIASAESVHAYVFFCTFAASLRELLTRSPAAVSCLGPADCSWTTQDGLVCSAQSWSWQNHRPVLKHHRKQCRVIYLRHRQRGGWQVSAPPACCQSGAGPPQRWASHPGTLHRPAAPSSEPRPGRAEERLAAALARSLSPPACAPQMWDASSMTTGWQEESSHRDE